MSQWLFPLQSTYKLWIVLLYTYSAGLIIMLIIQILLINESNESIMQLLLSHVIVVILIKLEYVPL